MLERSHFEHGRIKLRALGLVALLGTIAAFVLTMLCIFAGSKPNMMENYDIFTLNLTRLGDNIISDLDQDLMKINVRSLLEEHIGKRDFSPDLPARTPTPIAGSSTIYTPAPTPATTLRPRFFSSLESAGKSDFSAVESTVDSGFDSATSHVGSDISSVTSSLGSEASSAVHAVETELVGKLNQEFFKLKSDLDIKGWYSVHLLDYCEGYYSPNVSDLPGANTSAANPAGLGAPVYPGEKITKVVTSCTKHTLASDFDPKTVLLAFYYLGVAFTGLSLILSFFSVFRFGWVGPFVNMWLCLLAFLFLGVGSALTTAISVESAKLVTSLGKDFGIAAYKGSNFFKLTWTATALMFLTGLIWTWEFWHRFMYEFKSHLRPVWAGFKNGINPSRAPGVYEREKHYDDVGSPL